MSDQTTNTKERKDSGNYMFDPRDIPIEIKNISKQLTPKLGKDGEMIAPKVLPAKENGQYFGPVLLNTDTFLVQMVSRINHSAIVHRKTDFELFAQPLQDLSDQKKLHNFNIQAHYKNGVAKVYPLKRPDQNKTYDQDAIKQASLAITDEKQRAAFLAALKQTPEKATPRQEKTEPVHKKVDTVLEKDKVTAQKAEPKQKKTAPTKTVVAKKAPAKKAVRKTKDSAAPER